MIRTVLVSALALVAATPAFASDFNGPYAGIGTTSDNVQTSGEYEGLGLSGLGLTGFAGYDMPVGETVFAGIEANVDLNTADVDLGEGAEAEAKWGWGVGARLGARLNDSTGLYGRVGYQRNKVSLDGFSDWGDGIRFGLGLETGLGGNISLRAEFNHVNYEYDLINNQGVVAVVFGF